jgi:hypothetical protein
MTKTSLRIFFIFVLLLFSCNGNEKRQGNGAESENDTSNVISDDENTSTNFTKDEHNNLTETILLDENNRCSFNMDSVSFEGSAHLQARCLLRFVKRYGNVGENPANLPAPLDSLIGKPVNLSKVKIRSYLTAHHIPENDLGGSLEEPLSRANNNKEDSPQAKYFVIHDTSTPLYENHEEFPENINQPDWIHNHLQRWMEGTPKAHIFISRSGESISPVHLDKPWRATKFEIQVLGNLGKGLFIHTELIQPRRKDEKGIDSFSPDPGFSKAQLDRLALVYLVASSRRGNWMIPAFHAVLDQGMSNAHDDPQNFDINAWANSLSELLNSLENI